MKPALFPRCLCATLQVLCLGCGVEAVARQGSLQQPASRIEANAAEENAAEIAATIDDVLAVDSDWPYFRECGNDLHCRAFRRGPYLVGVLWESGYSRYSSWSQETRIYEDGHRRLTIRTSGFNGSYISPLEFDPPLDDTTRHILQQATGMSTDAEEAQGRAMLFLSALANPPVVQGNGFSVQGPLYAPGSYEMTERCSEDGELPAIMASAASVAPGTHIGDEYTSLPPPLRIAGVLCDDEQVRIGPHTLRTFTLLGGNAGKAIAVEGPDGRLRWALETRIATLGADVRWLGARRGWIFVAARSRIRDAHYTCAGTLFAIRARDATAVRIIVPPVFEEIGTYDIPYEEAIFGCANLALFAATAEEESGARTPHDAPRNDGFTLDETALRIQGHDGAWTVVSAPELFEVLEAIP